MNKTLIALAVSAAALAAGANAGEIYNQDGTSLAVGGRAEGRLSLKDGKADDKSRVRLNVLGKTQINDSLYGLGFYESELTTGDYAQGGFESDSSDLSTRYAYAGIGGNFGEVVYGKTGGALIVLTDFTDIMSLNGNTAARKLPVAGRADNMLAYKGQFNDLGVKASYRFADRGEDNTTGKFVDNNQDGYSLSAVYAFADTGFKAGAGYADQDKMNEYMLAASYTIADFYFAGVFTDGELAKKDADFTGYEFAAAYKLDQTVFTLTYNNEELNKETSADNLALEATYFFKPNFRAFISYNFNMIDKGDKFGTVGTRTAKATKAQAEDEVGLGLRYDF